MALTSAQRRALPDSAFVYPSRRAFPVPTKSQARRAGIPESQRVRTVRNALARANQRHTSGTYRGVATKARRRAGGQVRSVSRAHGTVTGPGYRSSRRR